MLKTPLTRISRAVSALGSTPPASPRGVGPRWDRVPSWLTRLADMPLTPLIIVSAVIYLGVGYYCGTVIARHLTRTRRPSSSTPPGIGCIPLLLMAPAAPVVFLNLALSSSALFRHHPASFASEWSIRGIALFALSCTVTGLVLGLKRVFGTRLARASAA